MNSEPLVSVITPTFNRSSVIHETIESVLAQTYNNWELLLIDDGSMDNTAEICERYAQKDERIRSYTRPDNKPKGPGSCRNIGIEKSNGEYIVFLDDDDLLAEHCLEQRVLFMQKNSSVDFGIFYKKKFESLSNLNTTSIRPNNINSYNEHFISGRVPWMTIEVIWRKQILLKNGGFSEIMIADYDDWEIHLRHILLESKFYVNNTVPDCFYRVNPQIYTANKVPMSLQRIDNRLTSFESIIYIYFNSTFRSKFNDKNFSSFIIKNLYLFCSLGGPIDRALSLLRLFHQNNTINQFTYNYSFLIMYLRFCFSKLK